MTDRLPFRDTLTLPVVAAPMFLISGPKLVVECCRNGIVGTFPALNQRSTEGFEIPASCARSAWVMSRSRRALRSLRPISSRIARSVVLIINEDSSGEYGEYISYLMSYTQPPNV